MAEGINIIVENYNALISIEQKDINNIKLSHIYHKISLKIVLKDYEK